MSSRSRRRSDIRRARQLVITSLATLGTVLLFGLASHGPVVIDAVTPLGQMGAFVILFCLGLFLVLMVKVVNRRLPDPKDTILGSGRHEVKKGPRGGRYTDEKTKDGRPYRRYF